METEKNAEPTTEKKLRNVRTCLYILILAAITKLAMTDFTELSYQSWISVIIIVLVIILVLAPTFDVGILTKTMYGL